MTTEQPRTAEPHHVVIVGGGFGGLEAAIGLDGAPVEITLIDRRNHHLFQPLLYQVATASLGPSEIAWPIRQLVHKRQEVTTLLGDGERRRSPRQARAARGRRRAALSTPDPRHRRAARLFRP